MMYRPLTIVGAALCLVGLLFVSNLYDNVPREQFGSVSLDEAKNVVNSKEQKQHSTLRRMVYRVGSSIAETSTPVNPPEKDSVHEEDGPFWNRALTMSSDDDDDDDSDDDPVPPPPPPTPCKWWWNCNPSNSNWYKHRSKYSFGRGFSSSNWWTSSRGRYGSSRYSGSNWSGRYSGGRSSWSSRYSGSNWSSRRYRDRQNGYRWGNRHLEEADLQLASEKIEGESQESATGVMNGKRKLKTTTTSNLLQHPPIGRALNLFVAGFPKCGTTTLLYALKSHPETAIGEREECDITIPNYSDRNAFSRLNKVLSQLEVSDPSIKTAIKCPSGIKNFHGIERLQHHSPEARFVIGVRHPVKFFQSFYNYRITEMHNKGLVKNDTIPSVQDLVGSQDWKGVSTDNARFELYLMQLGKTDVSISDMAALSKKANMAVTPTTFKIFLYSIEQLEDEDKERAQRFRNDMQDFLQLEAPLDPFERKNTNHNVGDQAFAETIDICDAKYKKVRSLLVSQAARTQEWIKSRFLSSSDVFVGNRDHFEQLLDSWTSDPCQRPKEEESAASPA